MIWALYAGIWNGKWMYDLDQVGNWLEVRTEWSHLNMSCGELKWKVNVEDHFNVDTRKTDTIRFLRVNIIHYYNMTTWSVDLENQLQVTYRINIVVQNINCWWSIISWYIFVMLTKSSTIYFEMNDSIWVEKIYLISHPKLQKFISLALINPN